MNGSPQRQRAHDGRFDLQQPVEPPGRARQLAGEAQEELAVALLRRGEPRIEATQLRVGQPFGEEPQPLLAARLDDGCDEEPVEQAVCRRLAHAGLQPLGVGVARISTEREAPLLEEREHLPEVARLLAREPRHGPGEAGMRGEGGEQRERVRRRLLLAVRVVHQHLVEALQGEVQPGARRVQEQLHRRPYTAGMRVGVISDTHGLVRPEVFDALRGVDHILHAGDIGGEDVLAELAAIAPVTACAGNVDGFRCGPAEETARVTLAGVRFFLVHVLDRPLRPRQQVLAELRREPADVVVFGHSHLPHDEELAGVRYFNPASAGPRRFDYPVSVGIFALSPGALQARHVPLDARSAEALRLHMNQLSWRS